VEGTRLGPSPLPLSDGLLLRYLPVAKGVREHKPTRAAGHQALGLRPSLPVRVADTPADER
jgi:hypothetical protein